MDEATRLRDAQRTGRRIGIAAFSLIMGTFVLVCSTQILYQGFRVSKSEFGGECRRSLLHLIADIRRARAAAAVEALGERAAMAKFRSELAVSPVNLRAIELECRGDSWATRALQAVDEWRWAEESAVRYESVDLAPSRRQIQAIESKLGLLTPKSTTAIP
jgi:hypothetical protein